MRLRGAVAPDIGRLLSHVPSAFESIQWLPRVLFYASRVPAILGTLLFGLGLARLRHRPMGNAAKIGLAVVVAYMLLTAALPFFVQPPGVLFAQISLPLLALVLIGAASSGYATWVPLGAWFGGEQPRGFWATLGILSIVSLLGPAASTGTLLTFVNGGSPNSIGEAEALGILLVARGIGLLAVFARLLPIEAAPPKLA